MEVAREFRQGMQRENRDLNYEGGHWQKGWKAVEEELDPLFEKIHGRRQEVLGFAPGEPLSLSSND